MKTLVVYCHPDPESYVASLRDVTMRALARAGHQLRLNDLYGEGFDPAFSAGDHDRHLQPGTHPSIARYADDLQWCEAIVLVYPTWWGGQPAMLKGWIDRVWACGVAWELPEGATRLRPRLRNVRRLVAVTTHGSSKWVNTLEGEGGKRTLTRALRVLCHPLCRTKWIALYGVDNASADRRARFLQRVDRELSRL